MTTPPLPPITDMDLVLEIYTHPTLRHPSAPDNPNWGNVERLEALGANVYDLVLSFHYFSQRPMLNRHEMDEMRERQKNATVIHDWLMHYGLKEKIRIAPADLHLLESPEEIFRIFHTYIGALYTCSGLQPVQSWISALIDPNVEVVLPNEGRGTTNPTPVSPPRLANYVSTMRVDEPMPPAPPLGAPPPPPPPSQYPNPIPQPVYHTGMPTLALINQTAAQKGLVLSYPAQQTGPPHAPTWTVRCIINDREMGVGVGRSQKVAKEDAAKQAWVAMGWGTA